MNVPAFLFSIVPDEPPSTDAENKQRIFIMTTFAILAGVIAIVVGPRVYEKFGGIVGGLPFGYAATVAILIVARRAFGEKVPFILLNVVAAGVIIAYGVCLGGVDQAGHLWSFVYIPVTAYALGMRKALLIHLGLLVFFAAVLFIPGNPLLVASYTMGFRIRFILAIILIAVTTYLIEVSLTRSKLMRLRLLKELESLNEKKNEYLGIVAHDLRNPLTTIIGLAELASMNIQDSVDNPEKLVGDLERISRIGQDMNTRLRELLDITAIESGKVQLEKKESDLKKIIGECMLLHVHAAEKKGIALTADYAVALPLLMVDPLKISSVIDNLLSNAVKYTHARGSVRVLFEDHPTQVIVHIKDSGQGLSGADLEQMFTTFRRLSARPTGGETSTGLGLAIVKKIVELHGGSVWVQSVLGQGSTFSFSVPKVTDTVS